MSGKWTDTFGTYFSASAVVAEGGDDPDKLALFLDDLWMDVYGDFGHTDKPSADTFRDYAEQIIRESREG